MGTYKHQTILIAPLLRVSPVMYTSRSAALDALHGALQVSDDQLRELTKHFVQSLNEGLQADGKGLAMM
jgi:hypothetical protein